MKQLFIFLLFPAICFGQTNISEAKYPFNLQALSKLSFNLLQNDTIIPVYSDGKFRYINSYTKQPVIKQLFDEAYPFHKGYGLVKMNNKYGVIDKKGDYVIKPIYDVFLLPDYPDVISFNYNEYFDFNNGKLGTGYYGEREITFPTIYPYKKGNRYGLTSKNGYKSEAIYDSVMFINLYIIFVKKAGKIGAINNDGKIIIPFIYDDYAGFGDYTMPNKYALKKNNHWLYFSGLNVLFEGQFKPALLNQNLFIFENGGLYNYFDSKGHIILAEYYKWISENLKVAINQKADVVIFNNKNEEFVYYAK